MAQIPISHSGWDLMPQASESTSKFLKQAMNNAFTDEWTATLKNRKVNFALEPSGYQKLLSYQE